MIQTPEDTMKYNLPDFSIPSGVRGNSNLLNTRMTQTKIPDTDCPANTVCKYVCGKRPQNAEIEH